MKKAYLLLSGCGSRDGSEIHEATLSLLALDRHGIAVQCIAPDIPQSRVVNHYKGSVDASSSRNAIVESARIARGHVITLENASPQDADLLIMPGGLGAVTTLSTYLEEKEKATLLPEVQNLIQTMHTAKKPIIAICISPVLIALTFQGRYRIKLTLGTDPSLLSFLQMLGMEALPCFGDSCVVDAEHRVISTPAYNEPVTIATIWKGISSSVEAALSMIE